MPVTPEIAAEVKRLYRPGTITLAVLAKRFGVSRSTILRIVNPASAERTRKSSLAAKRRRFNLCIECGARCHYTSTWCARCSTLRSVALAREQTGQGPTQRAVLEFLASNGPSRYIEIRDALEITDNHTGKILNDLMRLGLIVRVRRGVYTLP